MNIANHRQINLQPGLWKLARNLETIKLNETRLSELRGMIRVLSGLASCFHGAFESDDQVLNMEFNHLVADMHAHKNHNEIHADLCAMVGTMLSMASDNVIAVSKIDCARVFLGALESAEEILGMPKPPKDYQAEAQGMIDTVCQLMHTDSCFPPQDIALAQKLQAAPTAPTLRLLRAHLQKIGG